MNISKFTINTRRIKPFLYWDIEDYFFMLPILQKVFTDDNDHIRLVL